MSIYHYEECGLQNVQVTGLTLTIDDEGDEILHIPDVNQLHRTIVAALITKQSGLTGAELRFLRSELGLTQAKLAAIVHRDALAISRWEREEVKDIDSNAEALIRLVAREQLNLEVHIPIVELSKWCVSSANNPDIIIDRTEAGHYAIRECSANNADLKIVA